MNDPCTTDLADFGSRERKMMLELLRAWENHGLPDDFENDDVRVMLNRNSGYVFLTNSEYQTAVMGEGSSLESFYCTPYEGREGTFADLVGDYTSDPDSWNSEDVEYLYDIANGRDGLPSLEDDES